MTPEKITNRKPNWKLRIAASVGIFGASIAGAGYWGHEHPDKVADGARSIFGDEPVAMAEAQFFKAKDQIDQLKFKVLGGETTLFQDEVTEVAAVKTPEFQPLTSEEIYINEYLPLIEPLPSLEPEPLPPAKPAPLTLPETRLLQAPSKGEGEWVFRGLPNTSEEEPIMAKTFIRPDAARPYALVGVLLMDKRRVKLHMTGGIEDPGGDRGVRGPGRIPNEDRESLLAAWNGGFKGPHGGYGMIADGKVYRPMVRNLATIAVDDDGTIRMGQWGRDDIWHENTVAARQNAVLLVDGCEVSKRTNEGNDTWGYVQVNSSEFITWRSAIGLTANGDLMIAAGNSLSAKTLAMALHAAGACTAMQLDINTPYVLTSLFMPQENGPAKAVKFMDSMMDNPTRFLNNNQPRDFMYVTADDTNYK